MNIVHIAECAGGVDRYLEMLLPQLEDEYQQVFICSHNFDAEKYRGMVDDVDQIDMEQSFSPVKIAQQVVHIKTLLKKYRPDIVYCHSSFAGGLGRLAAKDVKCKIVYNPHGWAFNIKGKKAIAYKYIERMLASSTDKIVCISKAEYQSAVRNGIDDGKKLQVIENGINVEAVVNTVSLERKDLGIPDGAYVIGMVGRLTPQKAPDTFIRAAKLIIEKIPNSFFVIVGNGEQEEEIKQYAKENGIKLVVTGWTDHPYAYLKMFNVAVLLSRWEGFGLAVAEYMAAKKPIVATRIDAIPTLIEDGVDGLLVSVDSPGEVAEKVFYIYNHKTEMETMIKNAYKKVVERYDIHRVAEQHLNMFSNLIGGES